MKFQLDANAWIRLFDDAPAYESALEAFQNKSIALVLTQQVVAELTDSVRIKDISIIERNLNYLDPFLGTLEEDYIFVLGFSKLDSAIFSSEAGTELFSKHLEQKENKLRHVRDGIHLVNASETASTLVSCDRKVLKTAKLAGSLAICFGEFLQLSLNQGRAFCNQCKK